MGGFERFKELKALMLDCYRGNSFDVMCDTSATSNLGDVGQEASHDAYDQESAPEPVS